MRSVDPTAAARSTAPSVTVLGVMPPPVNGMSLCTKRVFDEFSSHLKTRVLNTSNGASKRTLGFRVWKFFRSIGALSKLASAKTSLGDVFYMPVDSLAGIYYNLAAAWVARRKGYRVLAHHHVYNYLYQKDWRIGVLDRLLAASGGAHVVLCRGMQNDLNRVYGATAPALVVPSTILLAAEQAQQVGPISDKKSRPFKIGHMSNLRHAKGIDYVSALMTRLLDQGRDVQLVVAGPVLNRESAQWIAACRQTYAGRFDYRGPVYGQEKNSFFQDIDVLLLPSRAEAQPIVISEAFQFGKPVLAFGLGCVPGLIGENGGWCIPPGEDYVGPSSALIGRWMEDPSCYRDAREKALRQAASLLAEACQSLDQLRKWVLSPSVTAQGRLEDHHA